MKVCLAYAASALNNAWRICRIHQPNDVNFAIFPQYVDPDTKFVFTNYQARWAEMSKKPSYASVALKGQ